LNPAQTLRRLLLLLVATASLCGPSTVIAADDEDDRAARARELTREGYQAIDESRYEEARRLFEEALELVPGFPEAVTGLERATQHRQVEGGSQSVLRAMEERDAVAWQRTVATYRDAERQVREHVLNNRFEQARQGLLLAEQTIEAGSQFADPISKYESLRAEFEALKRFVDEEEELWNQQEVAAARARAADERRERIQRIEDERRRQIDALMEQALQHRKDRDYRRAIDVLRQIVVIDPRHERAREMIDDLEDRQSYVNQWNSRAERHRQSQKLLEEVEDAKIPNVVDIDYPKNWLELISRETRGGTRRLSERDLALRNKLDRAIPMRFRDQPLEEVFAQLGESQDINFSINWNDLAKAGIQPKAKVTFDQRTDVPVHRGITEVLDHLDPDAPVGYRVRDGVVSVATLAKLDSETFKEIHPIEDLLMEIPDFVDAPEINLDNAADAPAKDTNSDDIFESLRKRQQRTRRSWNEGENDDFDTDREYKTNRQRRVDEIINLICTSVSPSSWIGRGGKVGSINEFNGQLVVTQTSAAQEEIADLLGKLRAQTAVQVAVEARFLTVQSNYLEEIGLDLDIILNGGNAGYDIAANQAGPILDQPYGSRVLIPREFTRLGFAPAAPNLGQPLNQNQIGGGMATGQMGLNQPFLQPGLVPNTGRGFIGGSNATPIPILNNTLQLTDPQFINSDLPGSFAGTNLQPALNVFGSILDNIQVDFLLRATQADARTTLLTAPRLTLFNGQRAWVAVVNQQSFVSTLQPVVAAGAAAQMPQIGNISTGAVLDVQAIVSADRRYVCMTLRPGVGRLLDLQTFLFTTSPVSGVGASGFVQLPSITRQVLKTTVCVPDGGTLLLGGQKLAGEFEVEAGVPILSKIPVLKRAYSSRTLVKDEQILLILVKPRVLIQKELEEEALAPFAQSRG